MVVLKRSREMVGTVAGGGFEGVGGFVGSERDKDGVVVTVGEKESVGSF